MRRSSGRWNSSPVRSSGGAGGTQYFNVFAFLSYCCFRRYLFFELYANTLGSFGAEGTWFRAVLETLCTRRFAEHQVCAWWQISRLREEQDSDEDTTADEEAAPAGSEWRGSGKPMQVGTGYTSREYCDGQSLAPPGRWATDSRKYPHTRFVESSSLICSGCSVSK